MIGALGRRHGDWIRRLAATVHCYDSLFIAMECVACERPIDSALQSVAARNVGAGFCDNCKQNQSDDVTPDMSKSFDSRALSFKENPALNDLDWHVVEVLKYSNHFAENESIANALLNSCTPESLKEARYVLLCRAINDIQEG